MSDRRTTIARRTTAGALLAAAGIAGALVAAPAHAAPAKNLAVSQVPNAGLTVTSSGLHGGFTATLAATAVGTDATQLSVRSLPANACQTNLKDARVAVTYKNDRTGKTGNTVFPVCTAGKQSAGATVSTGTGRIGFTTSIISKNKSTFTVSPGRGNFVR